MRFHLFLLAALSLSGCRGPMPRGREAASPSWGESRGSLVRVDPSHLPEFMDDGVRADLLEAAQKSADFYRGLPADRSFVLGTDRYSAREMAESLEDFRELMSSGRPDWSAVLRRDFAVYSSIGSDRAGTVVFSSYYEHSLRASLKKNGPYRFPIYGRPADLEEVTTGGERHVYRRVGGSRRPYFTRKEIDGDLALQGRGLEIAWAADPVDIFFLQVQGSGWLLLPNGEQVRVRYAANNGHPFKSVGGAMIERGIFTKATFSRKAMVDYLAAHPSERPSILNVNPRYVFFKIDRGPTKDRAYGSLNLPLTPGRSVALDPGVFPPGALAWMETVGKYGVKRFVLSQDEGGAIKGPARVDFFAGSGDAAERYAVGFWEKGRLYFLVKKKRP